MPYEAWKHRQWRPGSTRRNDILSVWELGGGESCGSTETCLVGWSSQLSGVALCHIGQVQGQDGSRLGPAPYLELGGKGVSSGDTEVPLRPLGEERQTHIRRPSTGPYHVLSPRLFLFLVSPMAMWSRSKSRSWRRRRLDNRISGCTAAFEVGRGRREDKDSLSLQILEEEGIGPGC